MTAKTTKRRDVAQEAQPIEETEADGTATEQEEGRSATRVTARKKVRRVRVIEVIDDDEDLDEDLGEVLDAMDAATSTSAEAASGDKNIRDRADDTSAEVAEKAEKPKKIEKAGGGDGRGGLPAVFGSPWFTTVLVALVLAAVATWALLKWHAVSEKEAQRQQVIAAASKFGDIVYSYDPANIQAAVDHNREMMAGDLLADYVKGAGTYKEFFAKTKWTWTSKTSKVYLSEMQGNLASAIIVIDINMKMTEGPMAVPSAYFTLGLVKEKGAWKISSMKAANSEAAAAQQGVSGSQGGGDTKTGGDTKDQKN